MDDRSKQILDELMHNPNVASVVLEKKYNLTRRQFGYSMNKINEWLMAKNLPVIERTRQGHFIIDQSVFTDLTSQENNLAAASVLSEKQRIYIIMLMLLGTKEELSLYHFTVELDVSKNTVLHDLKQVQHYLENYDLAIRYSRKDGYLLEGKEFQVRKLLIHITYRIFQMTDGEQKIKKAAQVDEEEIEEFRFKIEKVETKLQLKFTDEKLAMMPYILLFILRRVQKGSNITESSIPYEELSDTKEYQATEEIFRGTDSIPREERLFITLHLLTTNVYRSEFTIEEEAIPDLLPEIDNMLRLFEKSACIYLQERDKLLEQLIQHIKPAYYRIKFNLTETLFLQQDVSKEFKEIHHLVKQSMGPLEELIGRPVPDNESTFITMLISGWMVKQGESIEKKIKAIVVCPQGVSISRLMFHDLKELFPEFVFMDSLSIRDFLRYGLDYDIVFSTTSLATDQKLFLSKAFLSHDEKQRFRKQVMMDMHGFVPNEMDIDHIMDIIKTHASPVDEEALKKDLNRYMSKDKEEAVKTYAKNRNLPLNELIMPEHITLKKSVDSWNEAVRIAAAPLVKSGKVEQRYIEAMVHQSDKDPYIIIGPNIAIPHAAPEEGVMDVGMSLLRIEDGVDFTEGYRIHLIVIIAAVDKKKHIHALMQLMRFAHAETDRNQMIEAKTITDIRRMIDLYSHN